MSTAAILASWWTSGWGLLGSTTGLGILLFQSTFLRTRRSKATIIVPNRHVAAKDLALVGVIPALVYPTDIVKIQNGDRLQAQPNFRTL